MSDSLAIAAVTATLRNLLFTGVNLDVAGTDVTSRPPDRARQNLQGNRLNVFLYQTSFDPAWRNQDMPPTRPGEAGRPPLPLSLYYLVTAYSENDDEIIGHRLLGRAMGILHDHPLLGAQEIKAALAESNLDQQIERIRITPQPLSLEEMSKLWTTFQTQYRISAAYQACVVLIESTVPARAPVPVLSRGDATDVGVLVQASTLPPIPTFEALVLTDDQPSAELGDSVVLTGHHLDSIETIVINHRRLDMPLSIPIPPEAVSWERVEVPLPADPDVLPAGLCTLQGLPAAGEGGLPTNDVALAIAPELSSPQATRDGGGEVTITLDCSPTVVADQDVLLLVSDRALRLSPITAPQTSLTAKSKTIDPGDYLLRLRVDGIDSHLVDRSVSPPVFDPTQSVTVP